MKPIHLGEFHNVCGAQLSQYGLSVWNTEEMEYFIELICPQPLLLEGGFGEPPEEGGFQHVEGMRLPAVRRVEIRQGHTYEEFEVRELCITTFDAAVKWDLYIPRSRK